MIRYVLVFSTHFLSFTLPKVRQLAFAIIHSTTSLLPAWCLVCIKHKRKPRLFPLDVVTRWNSTYDMLQFVLDYQDPIDSITADKSLKLRKYELDDTQWEIIGNLISVLKVVFSIFVFNC